MPDPNTDPMQLAQHLRDLRNGGILTEDEYQAKLQQLKAASMPPPPAAPTANQWHMRRVEFRSRIGFDPMPQWGIPGKPQQDIVAMHMLVPIDWTFSANIVNPTPADCNFTIGRIAFLAAGPDKLSGLACIPHFASLWSNDNGLLQTIDANNRQPGARQFCRIEPPQPLANRIAAMARAANPTIQVAGPLQPIPGISDKVPAMLQQTAQALAEQAARENRPASRITAEAARVPVRGQEQGKPVEGFFAAMQVVRTDILPNGASFLSVDVPLQFGTFAPVGRMAEMDRMFAAMMDSIFLDPLYQQDCADISANCFRMQAAGRQQMQQQQVASNAGMAADNAEAFRQQQAIRQGVTNYRSQVTSSVAAHRSAAVHHSAQQFALHMADQAVYANPLNGHRVQMSNQFQHAWASTTGNMNEYILTDSPSYDPNGQAGPSQWTQMQQER